MGKTVGNIEGRLNIGLQLSGGTVTGVDIRSSRPLQTPRIFEGKSVEELLQTLPLLYSICGTAQANAAVTACGQALGLPVDARQQSAREKLVWLETAKEHLWRVLLDWPGFIGLPPAAAGVGEMLQLIKRFRVASYPNERPFMPGVMPVTDGVREMDSVIDEFAQLLQDQVFGMPPAEWLGLEGCPALLRWAADSRLPAGRMLQFVRDNGWDSLGSANIGVLPPVEQAFLARQLERPDAGRFIACPHLDDQCYETSPFTRVIDHPLVAAVEAEYGAGLLARYCARLVELAGIPGRLREAAGETTGNAVESGLPPGQGISQVEAARGRLVHWVALEAGRIARYQILAPTEWNFHPDGVLVQGLKGLQVNSADQLRRQSALLINAIDPCVGYELRIDQE
ncbi:nickel-dependent hydrogenase large subunit [Sedimenticola sp.]|uniref:nickel-dependent hydrogenase large subunit n=1 Tax=Sedimenticola sp. TaxID=1940285 RepID=UPI002585F118|nr:nickel-dependent hydrogenase large subunit [Sedimenticola sp.]MCW8904037.1 nickel-dependent hydrogenase large subunit [Sedimenticola sp.]